LVLFIKLEFRGTMAYSAHRAATRIVAHDGKM
jgi:hypothetical protein